MTPAEIIDWCEAHHIRLYTHGERLRYQAPAGAMTMELARRLKTHKTEILAILRQPPAANDHQTDAATAGADLIHWRDCTPEQLQNLWARVKQGEPVQIYSGTLSEHVWWVKDQAMADQLKHEGITEVCYTLAELRALAGKPAEFLRDIHPLKRQFGATLAKATAEEPEPADTTPGSDTANPSAGQVACGDCQHFEPDPIGDGTGIGQCLAGVTPRPQIDPPLYPKALRRCNHSSKEAIPSCVSKSNSHIGEIG